MVSERRLTLEYGSCRYLEAGSGWPVVLLHAFPLTADMWRPQLENVPEGWRFLAPDLSGFGPLPSRPARSLDEMAAGVLALLDVLRIDTVSLGGLSMGGYVMFAMLRRERDRFTALFLADTRATADTEEGKAARNKMLETVRTGGVNAVADEMLPKLLAETSRRKQPELEPLIRSLIRVNAPAGVAGAIEAMRDRPDSTATLASISVPTLVLCGEEDRLTPPSEARSMQAALSRSNLVLLPGVGHLSNMEAPAVFSKAISDFLSASL